MGSAKRPAADLDFRPVSLAPEVTDVSVTPTQVPGQRTTFPR